MSEFVWLEHLVTKGKARLHRDAVQAWTANGWQPCEPPEEVDPTQDPAAPQSGAVTVSASAESAKSTKSARGRASTEGSE